jgi:hypothetical protein
MGGHHTIRLIRLMRLIQAVIISLHIVFLLFVFVLVPWPKIRFRKFV